MADPNAEPLLSQVFEPHEADVVCQMVLRFLYEARVRRVPPENPLALDLRRYDRELMRVATKLGACGNRAELAGDEPECLMAVLEHAKSRTSEEHSAWLVDKQRKLMALSVAIRICPAT